jgi:hypothetical protein
MRMQDTCVMRRQNLPGDVDLKEVFGNSATLRCCFTLLPGFGVCAGCVRGK